jgi:hypothetical protein
MLAIFQSSRTIAFSTVTQSWALHGISGRVRRTASPALLARPRLHRSMPDMQDLRPKGQEHRAKRVQTIAQETSNKPMNSTYTGFSVVAGW